MFNAILLKRSIVRFCINNQDCCIIMIVALVKFVKAVVESELKISIVMITEKN